MQNQENYFENVDNAKKQRFIQGVTNIIKPKYDVHIIGNIPSKKFKNAVGKMPILPGEEVIVLIDGTIFGSAKEATLITTWGVRHKDLNVKIDVPWKVFKGGFKIVKKFLIIPKFVFMDNSFYNFECFGITGIRLDALESICKLAVEIFVSKDAETINSGADEARNDREKFPTSLELWSKEIKKTIDNAIEETMAMLEEYKNPSAESQKKELDELRRICEIDGIDFETYYEKHKNEKGGLSRAAIGKLLEMLMQGKDCLSHETA